VGRTRRNTGEAAGGLLRFGRTAGEVLEFAEICKIIVAHSLACPKPQHDQSLCFFDVDCGFLQLCAEL
jgi:hypothetical protein